MYSPNPQRHHLVLFHREKRQYNISKSAFFSLMSLVVCVLYVGLWDVKERIYKILCIHVFFYQDQSMMLEERGMNAKRDRHASLNMI